MKDSVVDQVAPLREGSAQDLQKEISRLTAQMAAFAEHQAELLTWFRHSSRLLDANRDRLTEFSSRLKALSTRLMKLETADHARVDDDEAKNIEASLQRFEDLAASDDRLWQLYVVAQACVVYFNTNVFLERGVDCYPLYSAAREYLAGRIAFADLKRVELPAGAPEFITHDAMVAMRHVIAGDFVDPLKMEWVASAAAAHERFQSLASEGSFQEFPAPHRDVLKCIVEMLAAIPTESLKVPDAYVDRRRK